VGFLLGIYEGIGPGWLWIVG